MPRSRASSPASARSDSAAAAAAAAGDEGYARLTARQRARMEKEAGIAEDVAWHEMELLPNLTYTWKGKGMPHPINSAHVHPALLSHPVRISCCVPITHFDDACSSSPYLQAQLIL